MSGTGAWSSSGACVGLPTARWFPKEQWLGPDEEPRPDTREVARAKKICGGCSVRPECLIYALENRVSGIWGVTTTAEWDTIRQELGIRPIPVVPNRRGLRGVLDVVDDPASRFEEAPEGFEGSLLLFPLPDRESEAEPSIR